MAVSVNVDLIQKLRDFTGAGVMECKKVLEEAGNDWDRAVSLIRERGLVKIEKRADRETGAGVIRTYVHNDRIGVLVDLRAETDFVVRSDPFQELAKNLAMHIAAMAPQDLEQLVSQPYYRDESITVGDAIKDVITRVGENIRVRAFSRLEL
ncbi:MAG: translation elongation factor Ts [Candidatus Liptonbacteria bacterium]|nr:translation elongation factor Ts [Candidatus Liptonbacteria bacterium]